MINILNNVYVHGEKEQRTTNLYFSGSPLGQKCEFYFPRHFRLVQMFQQIPMIIKLSNY